MNIDMARTYIVNRLKHELPEGLHYHGLHHTLEDVLPAAMRLADRAGITPQERTLLATAALYHDAGYMVQYFDNEPIGARIAAENLPRYGYTPEQIERIQGMILATRVPQSPQTLLERLLCDADLDSLGRSDYFIVHHRLQLELAEHGQPSTLKEWYRRQKEFLEGHTYHTPEARSLRDEGKQAHLAQIRALCQGG